MGKLADKIKNLAKSAKRTDDESRRGEVDWEGIVIEEDDDGEITIHSEDDLDNEFSQFAEESQREGNEYKNKNKPMSKEDRKNEDSKHVAEYMRSKPDRPMTKKEEDDAMGSRNMLARTPREMDRKNFASSDDRSKRKDDNKRTGRLAEMLRGKYGRR